MNAPTNRHPLSYRDPAGFVFEQAGVIYRQVNPVYRLHYDHFIKSGLYQRLVNEDLILPHEEIELPGRSAAYKILRPEQLPFISYPYEWSHTQLQDAALLTLKILQISLEYGMILKDATPYNIQFIASKPVFIDTLSWECYTTGEPWAAYRQYCEMFLAPLAISHYSNQPISRTLRAWPEGIPIELASSLLPMHSRFKMGLLLHIHLQSRISKQTSNQIENPGQIRKVNPSPIVENLKSSISKLAAPTRSSTWTSYYNEIDNRGEYFDNKTSLVERWIRDIGSIESVLDAGSNEGHFSKLLPASFRIVSIDADAKVVDRMYIADKRLVNNGRDSNILPLVMDVCDLSAGQGLLNQERASFINRGSFDLVLALALIHHLLIGRQVPMNTLTEVLASISKKWLIVEFVPMDDPWAQKLLEAKKGNVHLYDQNSFEQYITSHFQILEKCSLVTSGRWLYKLHKIV